MLANPALRFPVKLFEIRDRATFIPVMAVHLLARAKEARLQSQPALNPPSPNAIGSMVNDDHEEFLLRWAGYAQAQITNADAPPYILLTNNLGGGGSWEYDPYNWDNRSMKAAHIYIADHWNDLISGQVIDVEFILGESKTPKVSERLDR
jgi:hypothetical protein